MASLSRDSVTVQAAGAVGRAERLFDMRENNRSRIRESSGQVPEVIDLFFANPILTVRRPGTAEVSQPGAANLLRASRPAGSSANRAPVRASATADQ